MASPVHAIITGGSSGIGKALALRLAREGAHVTLMARRADVLSAAVVEVQAARRDSAQRIGAEVVDVTDAEAMQRAVASAEAQCGPCDLLLASAGIVYAGYFHATPDSAFEQIMRVNYIGSLNAVRAVLPRMRERRSGHIVFISSAAGIVGVYGYSAYCPSKFAVRGLADVLRAELRADGIRVSVVYPPDTDTPMFAGEMAQRPPESAAVTGAARLLSADEVAQATMAGIRRGAYAITPGATITLLYRLHSLIEPLLTRWFDYLAERGSRQR